MNDKFFELGEEKRTVIINGALKTFAHMGYRKSSTADIAAASNISKSLLFHYFGTKIELFEFVFNYSMSLLTEQLKDFDYRDNEDLFLMIARANGIKLHIFQKHPYLYQFLYASYFDESPEVQSLVRGRHDELVRMSMPDVLRYMDRSKLREGLSPEQVLQIILWVSEGFLQQKLMSGDTAPDSLLTGFNGWMETLKRCFYKP